MSPDAASRARAAVRGPGHGSGNVRHWPELDAGCRGGIWSRTPDVTALRQVATRLCLTLRNKQVTMKPCAAADKAALWSAIETPNGTQLVNSVSGTCLARLANDNAYVTRCTFGDAQRWLVLPWIVGGGGRFRVR
ncbi:ricin-type beta-trefoil lectin domain protein [Streptomyces sp. NPDC058145]|uniref:ricin-type beta-trefoil lectin domain protein n=1 Tax=Streptomyces sp. NPDC058145 TaxID=3346356 RepID=UPI0036E2DA17